MTDLAEAMAIVPGKLTDFEDRPVIKSTIEIPNAAGGLQEPMKFDPREFHHDEEVYVVMRCKVKKVRFDPVKDTDALTRAHVFSAEEATFIDGDSVKETLARQRDLIQRAKEREAGIQRLAVDGDEDPVEAHNAGEHAEFFDAGCPECIAEQEAAAEEAAGAE